MRKNYTSPLFEELTLGTEDVLTVSDLDNVDVVNGSIDEKQDPEGNNLF